MRKQHITCPGCHNALIITDRDYAHTVCKPCDLLYCWLDTDEDKPYCSILVPCFFSTEEPRADMPIFIQCVGCAEYFLPAQLAHCPQCHEPHSCYPCLDIAIGVTARDAVSNACYRCYDAYQEQDITAQLLARIDELEKQLARMARPTSLPVLLPASSLDDRILALIGDAVWHVDDIVRELNASIVEVSAALAMMEIFGKVKNFGGMNIQAARIAVAS